MAISLQRMQRLLDVCVPRISPYFLRSISYRLASLCTAATLVLGLATMAQALALYLDGRDQEKSKSPLPDTTPSKNDKPKKSDAVVKIEASATKPDADNKQTVSIAINIEKPWHLYANPVPADFPGIPTNVTIEANGKSIDAKIDYPQGKLVHDATLGDYHVYEDQVKIQASIKKAKDDKSPLSVIVKVQACSDKQCLLPSTVKVKVP